MYEQQRVAIIGAGAAGMMSAIYAAQNGALVTVFEKNDRVGKKLAITGKGRCNVTNDCDTQELLKNIISNPKFLYAAFSNFDTSDTKAFFENLGVPLKTERGRRVFPVSDKALDIVFALKKCMHDYGVTVNHEKVTELIQKNGKVTGLKAQGKAYEFDSVIVACGGASYPQTGSDGDGFIFAKSVGHTVTPLVPSLVPLETTENVSEIMGVSLKNVTLKIKNNQSGKIVFEEMGEMLFTHFGLSGPLVLSASCHMAKMEKGKYSAVIDFKPALDIKTLDTRILSDFSKQLNRDFQNALGGLLPSKIIPFMVKKSGIDGNTKVNNITKEQRQALISTLKSLTLEIKGFRPIKEAIITRGGVSVSEINPSTMESKKIKGLYFAGEVIDVDAYTGGYNLQIAFSTGALAGMHAAWGE
ncbi:MAG: NAD(P)/FAD-dependent oxidoreductase [Ruminococcaceae bacterium]|nr:NAD(P)/FAD-dependent oxidoreductase [Oscillospiraceae bacterium]